MSPADTSLDSPPAAPQPASKPARPTAGTKLSPASRLALLAAAYDALVQYDQTQFRTEPVFAVSPSHHVCFPARSRIGQISNATLSGRTLLRLGLLAPGPDGRHANGVWHAQPSEKGWALFDELATGEEKAWLDMLRAEKARGAKQAAAQQREHQWRDANAAELRRLRDRSHDRVDERHRLDIQIKSIAYKLGEGVNDMDDLLAALRKAVARVKELDAEQAADDAATPRYVAE